MNVTLYAENVKGRITSLVCFLLACSCVEAQPVPPEQVPKLPAISAKVAKQKFDKQAFVELLRAKFSRVKSYGFIYHFSTPEDHHYFVEAWKEMGSQHYYEFEYPGNHQHMTYAFDGSQTKILVNDANGILVRKGEFPEKQPLWGYQSPIEIYAFLNYDPLYLTMKKLSPDAAMWNDLATRIDYAGTARFLTRDCVVLRFHGATAESKDGQATYDVSFDKATSTPLRWQSYDLKGDMIEEVALVDTQPFAENPDNGPMPFIPHYKRLQYQWHGNAGKGADGQIIPIYCKGTREEFFDDLALNTLQPEDLQLDESQIKVIVDTDTHKVTRLKQ